MQFEKCNFFKHAVESLGHLIDAGGLHTAPSKVTVIVDPPTPEKVGQLRPFLGVLNDYDEFILQLKPLHEVMRESKSWLFTV